MPRDKVNEQGHKKMLVAIDILIILFIFLMIIYLTFDRIRFQIDQQYKYLRREIENAVSKTGVYEEFCVVKKTREKMQILAGVCKEPVFEEFHPYFDVHNELAFTYNEKLQKNIFRGIAKLMRFREYPIFRYSDDIVLRSRYGNRTIHI